MDQQSRNQAAAQIHGAANALAVSGAEPSAVASTLRALADGLDAAPAAVAVDVDEVESGSTDD